MEANEGQIEQIVTAFHEEGVREDLHLDTQLLLCVDASITTPQAVPESWIASLSVERLEEAQRCHVPCHPVLQFL